MAVDVRRILYSFIIWLLTGIARLCAYLHFRFINYKAWKRTDPNSVNSVCLDGQYIGWQARTAFMSKSSWARKILNGVTSLFLGILIHLVGSSIRQNASMRFLFTWLVRWFYAALIMESVRSSVPFWFHQNLISTRITLLRPYINTNCTGRIRLIRLNMCPQTVLKMIIWFLVLLL